MNKPFWKTITFSKRERNGIIVLLYLIVFFLGVDFLLYSSSSDKPYDFSGFEKEISEFEESLVEEKETTTIKSGFENKDDTKVTDVEPAELFFFDPNNTSRSEWEKLGLKDYQIRTIENYLGKGGRFYNKEDLKKIYGLGDSEYNRLKDFIQIKENNKKLPEKNTKKVTEDSQGKVHIQKIDINEADTIQLMLIDGIGTIYAQRICKYRELLGGYRNIEQLKEVYGLNDTVYQKVKPYFSIDTTNCNKLNLNTISFAGLLRHPYLNKYQTKSIIKYRELKGRINEVNELRAYNILPEKTYLKIKDYFICK